MRYAGMLTKRCIMQKVEIKEVCDKVDLAKVVESYLGPSRKQIGNRLWWCCPFHKEKTPSFCVDTEKNLWHCYGSCQDGGSVIKFVEKIENLSFGDAVAKLKNWLDTKSKTFTKLCASDDGEVFSHGDVVKAHLWLAAVIILIGIGGAV